ncbi:sushi, von Willebrand factor type A, EGF and pentraxin domain-containing protein 1-like isoform X2 [Haliotis rufescens]|uniref:sushi, von Willebrand factor type A, EGF and pentraxin domain-containing protein 1-like isoform X2 n=1 Tax=Haliotis rufescens TaxID=6454 RepID=UPI00201F87A6|nr:sushi, von Willebrand factor type A, EGF and pentraxin domain-containing protein 1-like isoform X2 [Haliotis rufescens]
MYLDGLADRSFPTMESRTRLLLLVLGMSVFTASRGQTTQKIGNLTLVCPPAVCPAGQYRSADNTCQMCAVGEYQPASGQTNCTTCDTGFTTKATGSNMATDCLIVCSAGKYRSSRTVCSVCDVGTYQPNTGAESCINCTTGFITSNNASTAESDCYRLCPAGQYRPASDRRACNECMLGTYQPSSGKTRCITCTPAGYITLQNASTKADDCMPSCGAGKYLNVTSRSCIPCPLGTFLPTAGTTTQCRLCPTGRTTTLTGATQEANCDLVDCQPGYFRKENQGCQTCGKGFYQPTRGQTSCIKCDVNTTTFLSVTNATDKAQCIADCAEGTGYNRLTKACDSCPIGQIRKPNISDYCYFCPTGQTTAFAGSKTCLDFQATTRAPVFKTVTVRMSFFVTSCQNPTLIHNTITAQIRFLITIRASVFPGLCQGSSCGNIAIIIIVPCGGTRRKRQTGETITAEVKASNLPEQIPNTDNTLSRSPESLLVQALDDNAAATPVLAPTGITSGPINLEGSSTSCAPGSVLKSGSCDSCPSGSQLFCLSQMKKLLDDQGLE